VAVEAKVQQNVVRWRRKDLGDRSYWDRLAEANEELMGNWVQGLYDFKDKTPMDQPLYVDHLVLDFKTQLNQALHIGVGTVNQRPRKGKPRRLNWSQDVFQAVCEEKEAFYRWMSSDEKEKEKFVQEHRRAKKKRKLLVRRNKRQTEQKIVEQIESLRCKDPREYWKRLKALSGDEDVKNPLPSTAVNEDNEFVLDKAGVEEVWARCFEKLGQQSDSKDEYNEEFISSVEH